MTEHKENQVLPPKTCSIERLITIPQDVEKVINGQKTAARRNGRYADVGEILVFGEHEFVIEQVYTQSLGELTDEHAKQEGFASVEDYKESILALHPGMPWVPRMKVWVHEFAPISTSTVNR